MDDQDADAAMREMMGFGSFGSNKRQKLNSNDQNRPKKPPTTSSNSTPLGTSRLQAVPSSSLSMIPSSLPPSGHSQPGPPLWTAAKLFDAVKTPDVTKTSEAGQSQSIPTDHPQPPNTTTDPVALTAQSANSSLNATANDFKPSQTAASHFSASDIRSDPSYRSAASAKQSQDSEVGYTSPWTGSTLTRAEVAQYGRGKREVQQDGSTVSVFFKPSFLATQEDLWGKWEKQREERTGVV